MTVVEYGDFECPSCGQAYPAVKMLLKRFGDRVRFVYRHLPLVEVHPHAELAAEAAEAAGAQHKFWQMHDLLFEHQLHLKAASLRQYALQAGANPASMITAQGVVVITLATVFVGAVDRRIRPSVAALRYAPRAAVVLAFAFAFMVEGMARAQASVVVPIAQMGFVVTALLGFLFLREPFSARKGAGLAAALAALSSLAHG